MKSCEVAIVNPLGLHARAAARFVHTASAFSARIRVGRAGREMDGKSIMGLLLLAAARGCCGATDPSATGALPERKGPASSATTPAHDSAAMTRVERLMTI